MSLFYFFKFKFFSLSPFVLHWIILFFYLIIIFLYNSPIYCDNNDISVFVNDDISIFINDDINTTQTKSNSSYVDTPNFLNYWNLFKNKIKSNEFLNRISSKLKKWENRLNKNQVESIKRHQEHVKIFEQNKLLRERIRNMDRIKRYNSMFSKK